MDTSRSSTMGVSTTRQCSMPCFALAAVCFAVSVHGFVFPVCIRGNSQGRTFVVSHGSFTSQKSEPKPPDEAVSLVPPRVVRLQQEILRLGQSTKRGFRANASEKRSARQLIDELAHFNPTPEPLSAYYDTNLAGTTKTPSLGPTLAGKWTLVYTDAPDITSLDAIGPLPSPAKLGRIGQECVPPKIKNVIEWRRPDWAASLPISGSNDSRVLQKVVTEGTASAAQPCVMNLRLVGIEATAESSDSVVGGSIQDAVQRDGLPVAWLQRNPIELRGPLTAPFGEFEVLYLDETMRIIKTGQNFVAVNIRAFEEWF